ncbi:MAG: hypothetical protein KGP28_04295 [Bdellovibrionales bacterium]|nr:hypothetical protein [Bdellovibrionales bacterium]
MTLRHFFHAHLFFALIFGGGFLFSISSVDFERRNASDDTGYELTPPLLKWMSGGFWAASHDFLWLNVVQELGEKELIKKAGRRVLHSYRLMQELDPFFFDTYEQGGLAFDVLFRDPDAAIEVLSRGIEVFETRNPPEELWRRAFALYLQRALVFAHKKLDFTSARRDYLKASEAPGAPSYLAKMRVWLKEDGAEKTLARKMLPILISNTSDPILKQYYQKQMELYGNE